MQTRPIDPVTGLSYSQALEVTGAQRLLFISGQVPADEEDRVPADYPSQYRLAWKNVEKRLASAGMTLDNLVKVTIYVSDRKYLKESSGIRQEILGERYPALTIIITGIYDSAWLLEIEAIAAA
jgi:2-iminobutanoate/2-iminopropanoate deaminase